MLQKRPAAERGHANHGWLDTRHTFSFASYRDPEHNGFGVLRVLNDDRVLPGAGFGTHGHRDMEIISYVVEGALSHRDSMGNGSTLRPGDVQRMSAGTGLTHSEFNGSETEGLRFLQIWVVPARNGIEPGWEERHFPEGERRGTLRLTVSPDGADGSLRIHQDLRMYAGLLEASAPVTRELDPTRRGWLQVVTGSVTANGEALTEGDGLAFVEESSLELVADPDCEVLFFEFA